MRFDILFWLTKADDKERHLINGLILIIIILLLVRIWIHIASEKQAESNENIKFAQLAMEEAKENQEAVERECFMACSDTGCLEACKKACADINCARNFSI